MNIKEILENAAMGQIIELLKTKTISSPKISFPVFMVDCTKEIGYMVLCQTLNEENKIEILAFMPPKGLDIIKLQDLDDR
jgi:hypothetical protein